MRRRWFDGLFCLVTVLLLTVTASAQPDAMDYDQFEVNAKACIVMEAGSGRVLYGKNIHQQLPMASTTKIMTTYLALQQPDLDSYFTVDPQAIQVEGSSMGLREGDQVSLRMLGYGMMLPSGNDAANAAAVRISGSIPAFVAKMNQTAQELGLEDTQFVNPSGLDADGHHSTAYDMARLAATAMENPAFRQIWGEARAEVYFGNPPYDRWLTHTNRLLEQYPDCIGGKTGFTDNARRCLVTAARRHGMTLICVTLNSPDDWNIHSTLYDRYFEEFSVSDLTQPVKASTQVAGGTSQQVELIPAHPLPFPLDQGERQRVSWEVLADPMIYAPVEEGRAVGMVRFLLDGEEIASVPLQAAVPVDATHPYQESENIIDRLWDFVLQLF